ncbi:MAG: chromate transporter [Paludibacteraceae bacterium]|nr:chromate transporter [Paludibacteraceae bacterium]MBR1481316.1 chromate transporter [Paludibacteraceae bacterium]
MTTLLALFVSFFRIGLFGFGGGYAILSLIQYEVEAHAWMTPQEFTDIVAISQMTPGPIGINAATYVGYTAAGLPGSCVATFAIILPSLIIMLVISRLYIRLSERFADNPYYRNTMTVLRFTVLGLIAAAALLLITPANFIDAYSWLLFAAVFLLTLLPALTKNKSDVVSFLTHPITLIVLAGCAGYLIYG